MCCDLTPTENAQKGRFQYEGTLRKAIPRFGTYHNVRVYSILRREFLEAELPTSGKKGGKN